MTQRVLITAGAGGIGLAIAKAYVEQGARVHIADVNAEAVRDIIESVPNISGSVTDVSNAADLYTLFTDVKQTLGGLDVLINNAGIAGATAPTEDYPVDTWNAVLNINLSGTFLVTQRAIPPPERIKSRVDYRHVVAGGEIRISQPHRLFDNQVGARRAHQNPVPRARQIRYHGKLHPSRSRRWSTAARRF